MGTLNGYVAPATAGGSNFFRHCRAYDSSIQGTWSFAIDALSLYNADLRSGFEQNNELSYTGYLAAGTYDFGMMAYDNSNAGICTLKIDGVSVGTMDWYAAAIERNKTRTITGISVTSSGIKTINLLWSTKNGASSGYAQYLQHIYFTRTA